MNTKNAKRLLSVLFLMWCLLWVALIVACSCQMCGSQQLELRPIQAFVTSDSLADTTVVKVSDIVKDSCGFVAKLPKSNTPNVYDYARGLDDLRQETNNIINKMNGWLSLWIGILAMVGAVFPVLIQMTVNYKQGKEFKEELNNAQKIKEKLEWNAGKIEADCKSMVSDRMKLIRQEIDVEKEKYQELYDKLKTQEVCSEVIEISNSMISAKENRLLGNELDRDLVWDRMLMSLKLKIDELLRLVFTKSPISQGALTHIECAMIQLHAVYCTYRTTVEKKYQAKQVEIMIQKIQALVNDLVERNFDTEVRLKDRCFEVLELIR